MDSNEEFYSFEDEDEHNDEESDNQSNPWSVKGSGTSTRGRKKLPELWTRVVSFQSSNIDQVMLHSVEIDKNSV